MDSLVDLFEDNQLSGELILEVYANALIVLSWLGLCIKNLLDFVNCI